MDREWQYLINPILSATQGSNVLGIRISNTHDGKLFNGMGDPFIKGLYVTYHPIHLTYIKANSVLSSKEGLQKGATDAFTLLIAKLGFGKINAWDSGIQMVYAKGTSEYIALLPNGHYPFQNGTQEERLSAAQTLEISIGTDAALETVKDDVIAFLLELTTADTAQKAAFSAVEIASKELETARVAMCEQQYGNLGAMIQEYKKDPTKATAYFDLKAIRKGKQIFFQNSVKKKASKFIVQRTVDATAQAVFTNLSEVTLRFYLSDKKTGAIGDLYLELAPAEDKTIFISTLGDVALLHYFMVQNQDTINQGEFSLEFL